MVFPANTFVSLINSVPVELLFHVRVPVKLIGCMAADKRRGRRG